MSVSETDVLRSQVELLRTELDRIRPAVARHARFTDQHEDLQLLVDRLASFTSAGDVDAGLDDAAGALAQITRLWAEHIVLERGVS